MKNDVDFGMIIFKLPSIGTRLLVVNLKGFASKATNWKKLRIFKCKSRKLNNSNLKFFVLSAFDRVFITFILS
jgi:hypothetical protein